MPKSTEGFSFFLRVLRVLRATVFRSTAVKTTEGDARRK
jgi:hypothetical protein